MNDLSLKEGQSFETFNTNFYARFPDLEVFNTSGFNAFKIVLDGLRVNYHERGKIRLYLFWNDLFQKMYRIVRSFREKRGEFKSIPQDRDFLIFGNPRISRNRKNEWFYFQSFIEQLGREQCVLVALTRPTEELDHDLVFRESQYLAFTPDTAEELELKAEMKTLSAKLRSLVTSIDHENICVAFQLFYEEYKVWNRLLKNTNFKEAIFEPHYHNEAFVYACRSKGIKLTEAQHGLISRKDIFYVFPRPVKEIRQNALFADRILLLGEYWDKLLSEGFEYPENTRLVLGDYFRYTSQKDQTAKKEEVFTILISSQTLLREFLWEYTIDLGEKIVSEGREAQIWFKPHPMEYKDLSYYDANPFPEIITVVTEPFESIIPKVHSQVSIYSTTLIDGLKFGVPSFSIKHDDSMDYVSEFIDAGITTLIEAGDWPEKSNGNDEVEKVFGKFYGDLNEDQMSQLWKE